MRQDRSDASSIVFNSSADDLRLTPITLFEALRGAVDGVIVAKPDVGKLDAFANRVVGLAQSRADGSLRAKDAGHA